MLIECYERVIREVGREGEGGERVTSVCIGRVILISGGD